MDHAVAALVIIMAMAMAIDDVVVVVAQESPSNIVNPSLNIYEMQ